MLGLVEPTCPSCGETAEIDYYRNPNTYQVLYTWRSCTVCGERWLLYCAPGAYGPEYERLGASGSGGGAQRLHEPEAER